MTRLGFITRKRMGICLGICGIGIIVSTFLTWMIIHSAGGYGPHVTGWSILNSYVQRGFHLSQRISIFPNQGNLILSGFFTLLPGFILIIAAIVFLFTKFQRPAIAISLASGLAAYTVAIFNLARTEFVVPNPQEADTHFGRGFGLWVLLVFSILTLLIGCVLLYQRDKKGEQLNHILK